MVSVIYIIFHIKDEKLNVHLSSGISVFQKLLQLCIYLSEKLMRYGQVTQVVNVDQVLICSAIT